MDEDEDDFLYGGNSEGVKEKTDGAGQEAAAVGQMEDVEVSNGQAAAGIAQGDGQDQEESDDDIDTDDSDSDLEIIVDGSVGAVPPVGYNARQPPIAARPTPVVRPPPSIITSDYTPNARPGQVPSASSLAVLAGLEGSTSDQAGRVKSEDPLTISQLPEGGPPPVPMTAPRLELDPSEQSLMLPPDTVDGEPGPLIYHVDPSEFEEKPWRRPGSDLTDWFNYGFNEESWKLWGEKKHSRTVERIDMETNGGRQDSNFGNDHSEQNNNDGSSNYMSQMPSQQMQAMQAMMGASGMSMPPEQMMAFMGMGPGGMPGMGMNAGSMMGMSGMPSIPGMGGIFGQQSTSQGGFPGSFGGMPNSQMMQQSFQQRGPHGLPMRPIDNMASVEEEQPLHGGEDHRQEGSEVNGSAVESANDTVAQASDSRPAAVEQASDEQHKNAPQELRGTGVQGAPTGPSRGGSNTRGSSAAASIIPTGPKNPGRRYNDRDTGNGLADSLDYGAGQGNARRDVSVTRSRSPDRRKPSRSRDASTDRDRDYDRDRGGRDRDEDTGRTSIRIKRDRTTSGRNRHSSPEDGMESLAHRGSSRRTTDARRSATSTTQKYSSSRRDDRRRSNSPERDDDWDKESIDSSASRRRGGTRQQQQTSGRSTTRSERRRGGDQDSGSETEKERKYGRSQARAERRAGRDGDDNSKTTTSRKRGAPEEDASPVRSSSARKRR